LVNVGSRGASGTLSISGAGSALTISDYLYVGLDHDQQATFDGPAGNGTATISAGGALRNNGVSVGHIGGNGTMLVTGAGSNPRRHQRLDFRRQLPRDLPEQPTRDRGTACSAWRRAPRPPTAPSSATA